MVNVRNKNQGLLSRAEGKKFEQKVLTSAFKSLNRKLPVCAHGAVPFSVAPVIFKTVKGS